MSLKLFHIVFVTLSVALCIGFAVWCFAEAARTGPVVYHGVGGLSLLAGAGLSVYGLRFLRKMKDVGFF